ncbi:MAG TPA: patatin-like phospholipase family protein [Solirubrobacteraceae bacterium]|nr:patatin-like phospholipase family protein [Solirubrobacteraceae bacterium]
MTHAVIEALRDRPPGARVALVVEGGGMRGAVSGGMALALDELGLARAFDAAYGSSAGTLNAMWLVSGRVRDGIPTWTDPRLVNALIRRRRALRGRPVVDVHKLVEERYEELSPGLFAAVLGSATELHPLATDVATGRAVDLHDRIADERSLRLALRASATLPLLAGPPVTFDGRRLVDAGLSAAIPVRAALEGGATHVLVLRSRRAGEAVTPPGRVGGALMAAALGRLSPAVRTAFLTRVEREGEDEALLARHEEDPALTPHVLSVRPPPGSPVPSRLERDIGVIRGGLEAGREAAHAALGG